MPDGSDRTQEQRHLGGETGRGVQRRVHLFGDTGSGNLALATFYRDFDQAHSIVSPSALDCPHWHERLWLVSSAGREVQRTDDPGTGPLTQTQVQNPNNLPAGASAADRTQLRLRLLVDDGTCTRPIEMDVGGSLELYAEGLGVEVLMPANFVEVNPGSSQGQASPAPAPRTGNVVDALVGVKIVPIESSIGHTKTYLTQHIRVPLNTQGVVEIPRAAIEVTIFQHTAGAASVLWEQFYGNPALAAGSPLVGVIPWIAGARKTEPLEILPNVTHLRTDLDIANTRFYTMAYTIQP